MSRRRILRRFKHKHFFRLASAGTRCYCLRCESCGEWEFITREQFWQGYLHPNMLRKKGWFRTWLTDMKNALYNVLTGW